MAIENGNPKSPVTAETLAGAGAALTTALQLVITMRDLSDKAMVVSDNSCMVDAIGYLASQSGYLLETVIAMVTGEQPMIVGGANEWMMPDAFNRIGEIGEAA